MRTFIKITLFFLAFCNLISAQSNKQIISGKLTNAVNDEIIPYAGIIQIGSNRGTTSSIDGCFHFELDSSTPESIIYISSIGYKDTLINLLGVKSEKFLEIELHPKVYQIDTVTIKATYTKKEVIGSKDYPILIKNDEKRGFSYSAPGWGNGVLVTPTKKQINGLLSSIDVFIADNGPLNCPFIVRIVIPKTKMIEGKLMNLSEVTDVMNETVIFRPTSRGWNKIELFDENILIPKNPFAVLFIPLNEGSDCEWFNDEGEKRYGSVIASTLKPKIPQLKWVINFDDKIAYMSDREVSNTPMVTINCLVK